MVAWPFYLVLGYTRAHWVVDGQKWPRERYARVEEGDSS